MKTLLISLILCAAALSAARANTAPTPVIVSAAMRPSTTLMDVVFRVNDPDDATVKVRALAFVDGERSFTKVLRPVTFVEGTAVKIGDAIASNTNHTLTWDVAADWNIDLGQVKFEILARDARGLVAFDWITIPAAAGKPALTISKDAPSEAAVLDALFWQYAAGDSELALSSGILNGSSTSGNYSAVEICSGSSIKSLALPFLFRKMNLQPASQSSVFYASSNARAAVSNGWHAEQKGYTGIKVVIPFPAMSATWLGDIPAGLTSPSKISCSSSHALALQDDGSVIAWGQNDSGQTTVPADLGPCIDVATGGRGLPFSLALKSDGTVVAWGYNGNGQCNVPAGLANVTKIAAGGSHALALKSDGKVVAWGATDFSATSVPATLSGVVQVAACMHTSFALKSNGAIVIWGDTGGFSSSPTSGVAQISANSSGSHYMARLSNGTVIVRGGTVGSTVPAGLSNVTAIAAGQFHCAALKADGTVVEWGDTLRWTTPIQAGLNNIQAVAAGLGTLSIRNSTP